MFMLDNMHESYSTNFFCSDYEIQEHADLYFHNEQVVRNDSIFYMHYESEDVEFRNGTQLSHKIPMKCIDYFYYQINEAQLMFFELSNNVIKFL